MKKTTSLLILILLTNVSVQAKPDISRLKKIVPYIAAIHVAVELVVRYGTNKSFLPIENNTKLFEENLKLCGL